MKEGDKVTYTAHTKLGLEVSGMLYSIDEGYRAYIITDSDIEPTAIKKNDIVKVLLRDGDLRTI